MLAFGFLLTISEKSLNVIDFFLDEKSLYSNVSNFVWSINYGNDIKHRHILYGHFNFHIFNLYF